MQYTNFTHYKANETCRGFHNKQLYYTLERGRAQKLQVQQQQGRRAEYNQKDNRNLVPLLIDS